jgi:hypothetical protein
VCFVGSPGWGLGFSFSCVAFPENNEKSRSLRDDNKEAKGKDNSNDKNNSLMAG